MGHVYRALMLAHEISNHKITFVCTSQSELAVEGGGQPRLQEGGPAGEDPLAQTVLAQRPDLVVNDFLNTSVEYMQALGDIPKVNFEDEGPGAKYADLVINALYGENEGSEKLPAGPDYFLPAGRIYQCRPQSAAGKSKTLLITPLAHRPGTTAQGASWILWSRFCRERGSHPHCGLAPAMPTGRPWKSTWPNLAIRWWNLPGPPIS